MMALNDEKLRELFKNFEKTMKSNIIEVIEKSQHQNVDQIGSLNTQLKRCVELG